MERGWASQDNSGLYYINVLLFYSHCQWPPTTQLMTQLATCTCHPQHTKKKKTSLPRRKARAKTPNTQILGSRIKNPQFPSSPSWRRGASPKKKAACAESSSVFQIEQCSN